jgi:primosomal protein N' (replication factor Y)
MLCLGLRDVVRCDDCAVSMTYHRGRNSLVCHYCGSTRAVPTQCPRCRSKDLDRQGIGTERVEAVLRERFPEARVARLDRDTAGRMGSEAGMEGIIRRMHAGRHRHPRGHADGDRRVTTSRVSRSWAFCAPDQGIDLPDFRAAERTFQLLEQVAGAGWPRRPPGARHHPDVQAEHAASVGGQDT